MIAPLGTSFEESKNTKGSASHIEPVLRRVKENTSVGICVACLGLLQEGNKNKFLEKVKEYHRITGSPYVLRRNTFE